MIVEKISQKQYPYCDGCAGIGCEKMCFEKKEHKENIIKITED